MLFMLWTQCWRKNEVNWLIFSSHEVIIVMKFTKGHVAELGSSETTFDSNTCRWSHSSRTFQWFFSLPFHNFLCCVWNPIEQTQVDYFFFATKSSTNDTQNFALDWWSHKSDQRGFGVPEINSRFCLIWSWFWHSRKVKLIRQRFPLCFEIQTVTNLCFRRSPPRKMSDTSDVR